MKNCPSAAVITGLLPLCLLVSSADKLFATNSDPDQARQHVGPDQDPNCFTLMLFLEEFIEKINFEKNQQTTKNHENLPSMQSFLRVKKSQI